MSETGENAVPPVTEERRPKVTRARMIIELADGSARYFEAREPELVEQEIEYQPGDIGTITPAVVDSVMLRIKNGEPWHVRIEPDSGEIPPELAERAIDLLDELAPKASGPLAELKPYLARIAGTW